MSERTLIATRDSYGRALADLVREGCDDLLVLDAGLAADTGTEWLRKTYSDHYIDCGVSEQNMMGVAAGLSTFGYVPFVSGYAMLAGGRAYEQVRNAIGYPHLNVKIGATHAGLSAGEDGACLQCCEDLALMRSIPGMVVLAPADDVETVAAVRSAYAYNGPVYIRTSAMPAPAFYTQDTCHFEIGHGDQLLPGNDVAIIACGLMVQEAIRANAILKRQSIGARVINMASIKPLDEELVRRAAVECKRIITVEEHSIIGGLGEAVSAYVSEHVPTPVRRIGVKDEYGSSGPAQQVLQGYGLNAEAIVSAALDLMKNYPLPI